MPTHVEITDPGAVRAAARALMAAGEQYANDERCMPEPVWGDDKFGAAMQANYPVDVVAQILRSKPQVARDMIALAEGADAAIVEHAAQEAEEGTRFQEIST